MGVTYPKHVEVVAYLQHCLGVHESPDGSNRGPVQVHRPDGGVDLFQTHDFVAGIGYAWCFPAGTRILMADGTTMPIEDVQTGDRVISAEGRAQTVSGTSARSHLGHLVSVKARGHSLLRMTPDHEVLTTRGYVPAIELRPDDHIAAPHIRTTKPIETIEVSELVADAELVHSRIMRNEWARRRGGVLLEEPDRSAQIPLDEGFGRLVGLYLAEGSARTTEVSFAFASSEKDTLAAEAEELLRRYLGVIGSYQERHDNTASLHVYDKRTHLIFRRLCGTGSATKALAPLLHQGGEEFRRGLLSGWLAGDGHVSLSGTIGTTISHALALDMFQIAQSLGHRVRIHSTKAAQRRRCWRVTVSEPSPLDAIAETRRGYRDVWRDDTHVYRRVRGLEFSDFAGTVYNLSVENDESYVAEGIGVHNCVCTWLAALDYAGLHWPWRSPGAYAQGNYARAHGLNRAPGGLVPGDGCVFRVGTGHFGTFLSYNAKRGTITTIDGNTSNRVALRERPVSLLHTGIHVPENPSHPLPKPPEPYWVIATSENGHRQLLYSKYATEKTVLGIIPRLLQKHGKAGISIQRGGTRKDKK